MARAILCTCSSLSITHGPAIRTSGFPGPKSLYSIGTGEQRLLLLRHTAHVLAVCGADERFEERMGLHGFGLEFGMELAAQEPGGGGNLADCDVGPVRGLARQPQAGGFQLVFVLAVELVAVAVTLLNFFHLVRAVGEAV